MASNTTKDMTTGSSMKLILGFAVPLLMGMLFQQVYSLVDTIIVGRFLGVNALAAVGATGSINFLIIGFCLGLCNGFALPVAQRFGAKDYDGLRKYVGNSAVLSVIVGGLSHTVRLPEHRAGSAIHRDLPLGRFWCILCHGSVTARIRRALPGLHYHTL